MVIVNELQRELTHQATIVNSFLQHHKLVQMRTTQMLLLTLLLASDVVTEASKDNSIGPTFCGSTIIALPCDNQKCVMECSNQLKAAGECVAEGCKCVFCIYNPPPSLQDNEETGSAN